MSSAATNGFLPCPYTCNYSKLGWQALAYAHLAPIQKLDEGKKRKITSAKTREANLEYYAAGYPEEAVIEYLLNLANSNFEDWRKANPEASSKEFTITWKKLANSNGPLFDAAKLEDIGKNIVSFRRQDSVYPPLPGRKNMIKNWPIY